MTVVVPVNAIEYVLQWTKDLIQHLPDSSPLKGYSVGTKLPANETPTNFIRVDLVGGSDYHRVGDRAEVRVQVWGSIKNGMPDDKGRDAATNVLIAHMKARLIARKTNGPINLLDPVNPQVLISQFTVSLLLIGNTQ